MACSSCARCTPTSIACAWVVLSWVSALQHVGACRHAARVAVPRQLERPLVVGDGLVQQPAIRIERLQEEVVLGELRPDAQPRGLEVGGARRRARARGLDAAADPAPEVQLPRDVDGQLEDRGGAPGVDAAVAQGRRRPGAGQPHAHRDRREVAGAGSLNQRVGLAELGLRGRHGLAGDVDLGFQRAQPGIAEPLPPVAAQRLVPWLRHLPAVDFLVGGRHLDAGLDVVWADGAGAEQHGRAEDDAPRGDRRDHPPSPLSGSARASWRLPSLRSAPAPACGDPWPSAGTGRDRGRRPASCRA